MADLEELRKLDATDFYPRRIIAKEMLTRKKDDMFILPIADGTTKLLRRDYEFREPSLRQESTVRSEDLSGELQGELEDIRPAESTDDAQAHADLWSMQGDFICRHHSEPRVQVYVPKEETFPIPLKCIDVTRSAHTDLDVMQEKRTDDYRNVDSNKHLSDSWRGFTKFTLFERKTSKRKNVVRKKLTKIQSTTRPDHVWTEV